MDALDFLARLAASVPKRHLLGCHGTLAPRADLRKRIVPRAPEATCKCCDEGARADGVGVRGVSAPSRGVGFAPDGTSEGAALRCPRRPVGATLRAGSGGERHPFARVRLPRSGACPPPPTMVARVKARCCSRLGIVALGQGTEWEMEAQAITMQRGR